MSDSIKCPYCGNEIDCQCDAEYELDDYDYMEDWTKEDWDNYYADLKEQEEEERLEVALSCTCGAWSVGKNGAAHHIADCICGNG